MNVGIIGDDNPDPIGTSVVTGTSVDIRTTATLSNGPHTFSVRQSIQYPDHTVGNRDMPEGHPVQRSFREHADGHRRCAADPSAPLRPT